NTVGTGVATVKIDSCSHIQGVLAEDSREVAWRPDSALAPAPEMCVRSRRPCCFDYGAVNKNKSRRPAASRANRSDERAYCAVIFLLSIQWQRAASVITISSLGRSDDSGAIYVTLLRRLPPRKSLI